MTHDKSEPEKPNSDVAPSASDESKTTRIEGSLEDLELAEQKELERDGITDPPLEPLVPWVIEFRVIGTPEIIRAPLAQRLNIGREDAKHDHFPEIDLNPYHGHRLGVSRKHARIIMRDNRITVEDLGSTNGSYVNGKHIGVLSPTRLRDGDQLKLGNLSLQVHFVIQPHDHEDTLPEIDSTADVPKIGEGQHILILDDNQSVCAVLRMLAIQSGYTATVTHDTTSALSLWDKGGIDAVIVEVMLEDNSGLDLVDYVRQNSTKHIPIIATSSAAGGYRESQARSKGVDELLEKPLSVDKLVETFGKLSKLLSS